MNSFKLEIMVVKTLKGFYLKILEQTDRNIFFTNQFGHMLNCVSSPAMEFGTLYLRGTHILSDERWVRISDNHLTLSALIHLLSDFAVSSHYSFSYEIDPNNNDYIKLRVNQLPSELQWLMPAPNTIQQKRNKIFGLISNLNITELTDTPMEKLICKFCKTTEGVKKTVNVSYYLYSCSPCYEKLSRCTTCNTMCEELKSHQDSLGNKKQVCGKCYNITNCMKCDFRELILDTRKYLSIDTNGNNTTLRICLKCNKNSKQCNHCGAMYGKECSKCPCLIPKDFKELGIHPYNADVTQILETDIDAEIGIEFEVGVKCSNRLKYEEIYRHTANLLKQDAIMMYDSSIDYLDGSNKQKPNSFRGFEIVTRPLNYENAIEFVNELADKRHSDLRSWDVETTGLHIHIARYKRNSRGQRIPFITRIEIGKLLVFVNDVRNRRFIKHIARRYNQKYAKLRDKRIVDYRDNRKECHYDALNTNKAHTIEFRIFRGSLNKETILSYIQFVYSLIDFIRVTPVAKLTVPFYTKWLNDTPSSMFRQLKKRVATYGKRNQLTVGGEA